MTIPIKDKFLTIAILLASVTLLVSVLSIPFMVYKHYSDDLISKTIIELTSKGVDPIAARCTMADDRDQLCILYVSTKKVVQ